MEEPQCDSATCQKRMAVWLEGVQSLADTVKLLVEGFADLHKSLHGDSESLNGKYISKRLTDITESLDRVLDAYAKIEDRILVVETDQDKMKQWLKTKVAPAITGHPTGGTVHGSPDQPKVSKPAAGNDSGT